MTELEKLGYIKKKIGNVYTEWVNEKENVCISYILNKGIMIRTNTSDEPIPITPRELCALAIDLGYAELEL